MAVSIHKKQKPLEATQTSGTTQKTKNRNMTNRTVEVNNGLKLSLQVPDETTGGDGVAEYNRLANRPGENAVVVDANDNEIYRGILPDFWWAMAHELKKEHGIEFLMKDHPDAKKDATGAVIQVRDLQKDSNPKYVNRVAAALGLTDPSEFQPIADRICADGWDEQETKGLVHHSLKFDPSVRERQVKIPTPGKEDLARALELITAGKVANAVKKISTTTGKPVVLPASDGTPEQQTALQNALALAIRDYGLFLSRANKAALTA